MIDAVIFDMDGVLADSEPLHFDVDFRVLSTLLGIDADRRDLEVYVGMTNPEMWKLLKEKHRLTQPVEEIIEYQLKMKIDTLQKWKLEPVEGVTELLELLREQSIPTAVASSSPPLFIDALLRKCGISDFFQFVISGEEVPSGKPAPDIYLETANLLGVHPGKCLVIEDSGHGVRAAKAAGMRCAGYINPNSGSQNLSEADLTIQSLKDPALLDVITGVI